MLFLLAAAGFWAGAQNALAGGGSFITFPALLLAVLDPRAANITSCVALFPGQIAMSWSGRRAAGGVGKLGLKALFAISLVGGVLGALLLLATPATFFARLVPWLVLFATLVFALGYPIRRRLPQGAKLPPWLLGMIQLAISVYGGYFGGGIGFLMLAALTLAGQAVR
ncbi:MAG: TSUP family transporter, partial [Gemmatimonadales bacterium]